MTDHTIATPTASARVKPDADPADLADLIAWLEARRRKAIGRVAGAGKENE